MCSPILFKESLHMNQKRVLQISLYPDLPEEREIIEKLKGYKGTVLQRIVRLALSNGLKKIEAMQQEQAGGAK